MIIVNVPNRTSCTYVHDNRYHGPLKTFFSPRVDLMAKTVVSSLTPCRGSHFGFTEMLMDHNICWALWWSSSRYCRWWRCRGFSGCKAITTCCGVLMELQGHFPTARHGFADLHTVYRWVFFWKELLRFGSCPPLSEMTILPQWNL